jgi:hypothetical protein
MMVGHVTDHICNCYERWDPTTGDMYTTRDVIWLKRIYFPKQTVRTSSKLDPTRRSILIDIHTQHSNLKVGEGTRPIDYKVKVETINEEVEEEAKNNEETEEIPELSPPATQSGQAVKLPESLIKEMNAAANHYKIMLSPAEENDYAAI